jgi:glycosyltransferase involved in cell wall biosynthesis
MAVYNGEKYLVEQIDSIICQLEPQDELVISYDSSSDRTWEILEKYQKDYPKIIKLYSNNFPGVFGNFENAIRHCIGDYIFISDQDDRWHPDKRQIVIQAFSDKDVDMVIHNGMHMNHAGDLLFHPFFTMYRIGPGRIRNIVRPRYSGCCIAFKASLARFILPIPTSVGAYDHWVGTIGEFFGSIKYIDDVLLYHRLHETNVTPKVRRSIIVIIKARLNLIYNLVCRIYNWKNQKRS